MDNPFINFNKTHTPTEEGLYMLLSKLPTIENIKQAEIKTSTLIKSPNWSIPWAWAGGFSMMGAMAALVFMFNNMNVINNNTAISESKMMTAKSEMNIGKINNDNISVLENKKIKNSAIIDEALATVSGIESMTADNKF